VSHSPTNGGPSRLSPRQRWFSLAEFVMGAAIVLGYNVYHVIPNEVPILFVLALISFRLRDGSWSAMGLRWPVPWRRTVLFALAAAATRILLGAIVVDPLTARFWPPAVAPSGFNEIAGHPLVALRWLGLVWTFAAFGEEISYRGYLLNRAADTLGRSRVAYWIAALLAAVLFGYGHYYKGPAGIVDSGMAGPCRRLPSLQTQSLGLHSGPRLHRHLRRRRPLLRLALLIRNGRTGCLP
jgi:uncharacterized protein